MKQNRSQQIIHLSTLEKTAGLRTQFYSTEQIQKLRFHQAETLPPSIHRDVPNVLGRIMASMAAVLMLFFYPGGVMVADAEGVSTGSSSAESIETAPAPIEASAVAGGSTAQQQVNQTTEVTTTTQSQAEQEPPTDDSPSDPITDNADTQVNQEQEVSISHDIDSEAESGNATVKKSQNGGDAKSGDASVMANIVNMLNSGVGLDVTTFSQDIFGDVFGDLIIDTGALPAAKSGDIDFKSDVNATIQNDINLKAKSGDATVQNNHSAGDASTGNATAVANIVNLLNSAISAGGAFMGVINIYGNLNGDILLPDWLLESILKSDDTACDDCSDNNATATVNNHHTINNSVTATAQSGTATVAGNQKGGNASSGNAQTDVTILNLSSSNVVAANSLLVFVNVMGHWVGLIVDAPQGATSAALATDISDETCTSCNGTTSSQVNANYTINNNVNVSATTGNALVQNNKHAGNASTGDATAKVSIANVINSSFNLSGWLGVLFINVFGSWNGSFGVDTAAGEKPNQPKPDAKQSAKKPKVFRFVPKSQGGGMTLASVDMSNPSNAAAVQSAVKKASTKLKSKTTATTEHRESTQQAQSEPASVDSNFLLPLLGFMIGGTMLGGERLVSRRQRRKLLS